MSLTESLRGITCPIVTPFDAESLSVDEVALESLLDHLLAGGIDGLFPCGTTGEFASLSPEERLRVTELTVEHADGEVPVVAGAAATSVAETQSAIEDAARVGADAAVVVPPYFHAANDPVGNERFFEAIADASPLPLLLYNIPVCTGNEIAPETLAAVAEHERIVGLKDSSGDLEYFLAAMDRTPADFLLLQGYDSLLVPALRMGADGGVNALSNVFPARYGTLLEHATVERGRKLQSEVVTPLFEACGEFGFAPATKTALAHRGVIPTDAVRPPLVSVPPVGRDAIGETVDDALAE